MKPAPAISTCATIGLGGNAATRACRQLARILPRALASRMRDCWRSRRAGGRAYFRPRCRRACRGRHQVFGQAVERLAEQCSINVFKRVAPVLKGSAVYPKCAQSTSSGSTSIDQRSPAAAASASTRGSQSARKRCSSARPAPPSEDARGNGRRGAPSAPPPDLDLHQSAGGGAQPAAARRKSSTRTASRASARSMRQPRVGWPAGVLRSRRASSAKPS